MQQAATLQDLWEIPLETLAEQARAPRPESWQPAVCGLVARSSMQQEAFPFVRELLLSELPELRYRAVVGLQEAAVLEPESLVDFLQDRWSEDETRRDPVLLQALVHACQRLPESLLEEMTEELWDSECEALRCSAIPLLWRRISKRGAAAVEPAICDECAQVRASVALELTERLPISVAFEGLARLVHDPELEVRASLALGLVTWLSGDVTRNLGTPEFRYLWMTLEADKDPLIQEILGGVERPDMQTRVETNQAFELMDELQRTPEVSLKKLSPWLRMAGSWHRLKTVAEFSCHPEVAQVARALAILCDEVLPPADRLYRCLVILQNVTVDSTLGELRAMTAICLDLVEAPDLETALQWARQHRRLGEGRQTLHWAEVNKLARILQKVNLARGVATLGRAAEEVRALRILSSSGPLPERELIEPALERMEVLIDRELSELMGEVEGHDGY